MPTDADMQALLRGIHDYWNPTKNPGIRYTPVPKRVFHRDRNYAVILGLLDSACRIGEMLSLKVDDYRAKERQIVIRGSKGREPRTLPVSADWVDALGVWLRQRGKIMAGQAEDEGWLFLSEIGGRLDEGRFLKAFRKITAYAGASDRITLHSLRRYSLNRLAELPLGALPRFLELWEKAKDEEHYRLTPLVVERVEMTEKERGFCRLVFQREIPRSGASFTSRDVVANSRMGAVLHEVTNYPDLYIRGFAVPRLSRKGVTLRRVNNNDAAG